MIFYHGTSKENWKTIQKEGILFGRRFVTYNNGNIIKIKEVDRCTYLAVDLDEAKCYGDVVLQVEYDPFKHKKKNNYMDGCWQIRVYEPIPLSNIIELENHRKENRTMEIIKKGTKKLARTKKCSKCRCLFTYTEKDKNIDRDGVYVICPQCGSYIAI